MKKLVKYSLILLCLIIVIAMLFPLVIDPIRSTKKWKQQSYLDDLAICVDAYASDIKNYYKQYKKCPAYEQDLEKISQSNGKKFCQLIKEHHSFLISPTNSGVKSKNCEILIQLPNNNRISSYLESNIFKYQIELDTNDDEKTIALHRCNLTHQFMLPKEFLKTFKCPN